MTLISHLPWSANWGRRLWRMIVVGVVASATVSRPTIQVNLFQKASFLHQLTRNMTRDCSLNSLKNTSSEHVVFKNCFMLLFWHSKQHLYTTCSILVFFGEINEQSLVILWVNWCKNESFLKRFTCHSGLELWFREKKESNFVQKTWKHHDAGKSVTKALILESVNPQYDKRLFIELQEKYKFRTCRVQISFKKWLEIFLKMNKRLASNNGR